MAGLFRATSCDALSFIYLFRSFVRLHAVALSWTWTTQTTSHVEYMWFPFFSVALALSPLLILICFIPIVLLPFAISSTKRSIEIASTHRLSFLSWQWQWCCLICAVIRTRPRWKKKPTSKKYTYTQTHPLPKRISNSMLNADCGNHIAKYSLCVSQSQSRGHANTTHQKQAAAAALAAASMPGHRRKTVKLIRRDHIHLFLWFVIYFIGFCRFSDLFFPRIFSFSTVCDCKTFRRFSSFIHMLSSFSVVAPFPMPTEKRI